MRVRDRTGQTWRVTRRWVPWRRRVRGLGELAPDVGPSGDDPISVVLGVVSLVLFIPFLLVAVLAVLELLLLLLLLPVVVLARVVLTRHWTIEARRGFTIWWDDVSGSWRESGRRIRDVADAIERGDVPPRTVGAVGAAPPEPGDRGTSL